jgi:hypothetical protein
VLARMSPTLGVAYIACKLLVFILYASARVSWVFLRMRLRIISSELPNYIERVDIFSGSSWFEWVDWYIIY